MGLLKMERIFSRLGRVLSFSIRLCPLASDPLDVPALGTQRLHGVDGPRWTSINDLNFGPGQKRERVI